MVESLDRDDDEHSGSYGWKEMGNNGLSSTEAAKMDQIRYPLSHASLIKMLELFPCTVSPKLVGPKQVI